MSNIEETVMQIVSTQLGVKLDDLNIEDSFTGDLGGDSLDTVELIMTFEEEFSVEISEEDSEKITTIKEAIDYLQNELESN